MANVVPVRAGRSAVNPLPDISEGVSLPPNCGCNPQSRRLRQKLFHFAPCRMCHTAKTTNNLFCEETLMTTSLAAITLEAAGIKNKGKAVATASTVFPLHSSNRHTLYEVFLEERVHCQDRNTGYDGHGGPNGGRRNSNPIVLGRLVCITCR